MWKIPKPGLIGHSAPHWLAIYRPGGLPSNAVVALKYCALTGGSNPRCEALMTSPHVGEVTAVRLKLALKMESSMEENLIILSAFFFALNPFSLSEKSFMFEPASAFLMWPDFQSSK